MKDFHELALTRQSCRAFDERYVSKDDILKCVETARMAPSGCNSQPWRFTAVMDGDKRTKLAGLLQIIGGNKFADKAPVLIAVSEIAHPAMMQRVQEKWGSKRFAEGDLGAAAVMLTLRAAELGLSTCIMGTFEDADVKKLLDIPEDDTVRVVIALGYPADPKINAKNRKPAEEILRFI